MDVAVKSLPASRAPTFLALDATVGARRRPAADARIGIRDSLSIVRPVEGTPNQNGVNPCPRREP
jgi:hypothetical protein